MEVKDLMRFRDKAARNKAAIDYFGYDDIELLELHLFETKFEYHLYARFNKQ